MLDRAAFDALQAAGALLFVLRRCALVKEIALAGRPLCARRAILSAALFLAVAANASDLVWIGGTGNWNAAGNWSPAQVPGAADNAFITNNGTYTVTVPAGTTATAGSLAVGGLSGLVP